MGVGPQLKPRKQNRPSSVRARQSGGARAGKPV